MTERFLNPVNKETLRLAVPSILANITVPLVGIVDLAIAGHIGDASVIGGIVIGTALFDLLYWNMGFLRTGTGGMTAQAFGRRDWKAATGIFSQGMATAIAVSVIMLAIQWGFAEIMLRFFNCSPEVDRIARSYFFIRIWAVPATLALFVFKGWFIGMQNTLFPMIVDIWVNVVNMGASWLLAFRTPAGLDGIAIGTVTAQWTGLILAASLMYFRYHRTLVSTSILHSMKWKYFKLFFGVNINLFVRSLLMLVVYEGFTYFAARFGDTQLAVSEIMMKVLLLYSYFLDGFAYAGEALTGRAIGEKNPKMLRSIVFWNFFWCFVISIISTALYALFPDRIVGVMTNDAAVLDACKPYFFWMLLMPVVSCIAFTWDGIFIGAIATKQLRGSVGGAALLFVAFCLLFRSQCGPQVIYIAYFLHLLYRSAYMAIVWPKVRRSSIP